MINKAAMPKILITLVEITNLKRFFGQTESGEILPECDGYPDKHGDITVMELFPVQGFSSMSLEQVEESISTSKVPLVEVELSGFESEAIESVLPKGNDIRWFIKKTKTAV